MTQKECSIVVAVTETIGRQDEIRQWIEALHSRPAVLTSAISGSAHAAKSKRRRPSVEHERLQSNGLRVFRMAVELRYGAVPLSIGAREDHFRMKDLHHL